MASARQNKETRSIKALGCSKYAQPIKANEIENWFAAAHEENGEQIFRAIMKSSLHPNEKGDAKQR